MTTVASVEEKPKKRAPRKRVATKAVRKRVVKKTVRKRAPRKRVARKAEPTATVSTSSTRKAPTPIAANRASSKAKQKQMILAFVVAFVSVGLSAAVGFTDKGQIDVNKAIEDRNERIRSGQGGDDLKNLIVPVQNTDANKLPDGGLVGLGKPEKPKSEPKTASSTASSTDETASSTDESNEEPAEIEAEDEAVEELEEVIEPEPTTGEGITVEPVSGR